MQSSSLQIENFGSREDDDKRIDLGRQNCSPQIRTDTALGDQLPKEVDKDASQSHIGGNVLYFDYVIMHCSKSVILMKRCDQICNLSTRTCIYKYLHV